MRKLSSIKRLLIVLFLLAGILIPLRKAVCQTVNITNQSQLREYLRTLQSANPSKAEFTCSGDLYSELKNNSFFELYHILVKAGIDYGQVVITYNDFRHFIQIGNISFLNLPWSECHDMEDVRQAVRNLAHNREGFILLCPVTLADGLSEGNAFHRALVRSGIESYRVSFGLEAGIIRISSVRYLAAPYAVVSDYAQFASAAAGFDDSGITDFYIIFAPELFERISNDSQQYTIMLGASRLGSYQSAIDPGSCSIRFSNVEFTDAPREICRSLNDVPEAIRRMGTAGIRDFELIFPDTSVFDALFQNDFALLLEIQASAGMSGGKIAYSSSSDRIIFTDAEITANAVMLNTLADAVKYTEAQVSSGSRDIHLFCTADLFEALMGDLLEFSVIHDGMNRIYDLIAHSGIFNYDLSSVRASHVINIHINRLFPGTAIIQAVRTGDSGSLTSRELELWNAASHIASSLQTSDPLQTARAIHDWICEHVVYADDEYTDEDDNAIGAILNGRANCDGYSDAFYLLGSLAGLNIRYQHGDSYEKDPVQMESASTHLWNMIEINGQWHMTDVTWDDEPYGWGYQWFNVGRDAAEKKYIWNEDMTVPVAAH